MEMTIKNNATVDEVQLPGQIYLPKIEESWRPNLQQTAIQQQASLPNAKNAELSRKPIKEHQVPQGDSWEATQE